MASFPCFAQPFDYMGVLVADAVSLKSTDARPLIGVAGDGAQRAYVLTPTSDTQLSYNMTTFLQAKGVVGALAIADIGLDGYADIFAPDYDSGIVHVFTFAP